MPTITLPPVINKPDDKNYCFSCDRAGLAVLVMLFGWSCSRTADAGLAVSAQRMARSQRQPARLDLPL